MCPPYRECNKAKEKGHWPGCRKGLVGEEAMKNGKGDDELEVPEQHDE
jgi:hypothetical protein